MNAIASTELLPGAGAERVLLLRSLESRCRQSRLAFPAMVINTTLLIPLIGRGLDLFVLLAWLAVLLTLLLARFGLARYVAPRLDTDDAPLESFDTYFRVMSISSQILTGAGIWLVPMYGDEIPAYVMTLLIAFYGVGTMINLAHDYRSARISLPFLMGQPALYWALHGILGAGLAVILVGLTLMMLSAARSSQRTFDTSIVARFENDRLMRQIDAETRATESALIRAEQANREKSFFMAAASHDLRQPLYAASILRDALALQPLSDDARRLVEQQGQALSSAGALFDNLLDLSKFESGVVTVERRAVSLDELLAQVASEFRPQCQLKGLALSIDEPRLAVETDPDLLLRMLRNLVSNSVRYTSSGLIAIRVFAEGPFAAIEVRDSGTGISAEDQQRVFHEFVQLENPSRTRDKGVGLGLAIVRHISKLLDAGVVLESQLGRGTTVRFHVPIANRRSEPIKNAPLESAQVLPPLAKDFWIVDDDPLVREALCVFIRQLGGRPTPFATASAVKDASARSLPPDHIILDDMLGESTSGLDLAHWLTAQLPTARILITTGNSVEERWGVLQSSGFSIARKPVSATALLRWVLTGTPSSEQT
jgi:signal transduction histidine kinase/CheY-like chemotaxis protein